MPQLFILVIENDQDQARDLKIRLENLGYTVQTMPFDDVMVLQHICKISPEMIILNKNVISGMAGNDFGQQLLEKFNIPIIILSSECIDKSFERKSPITFLKVPLEKSHLIAAIDIALYKHEMNKTSNGKKDQCTGLFEQDLTGDFIVSPDGFIKSCNTRFMRMLSFNSMNEVNQTRFESLFSDEDEYEVFMHSLNEHHKLERYYNEFVKQDDTPIHVIGNFIRVENNTSGLKEIRGFLNDITESKKLEEQLFQAQKAACINNLTRGFAHDFGNVLSIILGHGSFIKMSFSEDHPLYKHIDTIEKSANRAGTLLKQLRSFSMDEKRNILPININYLIRENCEIIYRTFPKLIRIDKKLYEPMPRIKGDAGQLQQVIMNLCINARDAMTDGGELFIESTVKKVTAEELASQSNVKVGQYVCISVKDTGVGIENQNFEKIFKSTYTTQKNQTAKGLGLAVVERIVKNHAGFIDVQSTPGKGSTFTVYLPVIFEAN